MKIKSLIKKIFLGLSSNGLLENIYIPSIDKGPTRTLNISLLGTCQLEMLINAAQSRHRIRHVLLDSSVHAVIPEPRPDDDATIVNISLRQLLTDSVKAPHPKSDMVFARFKSADDAQALLDACDKNISHILKNIHAKYDLAPVFFLEFFEPSFNYLGDLQDIYSITSPRQFVRKLNEILSLNLKSFSNFHLIGTNDLLNFVGRECLHDDIVLHGSHASFINDWDFKLDSKRLSAPQKLYSAALHERAMRKFTVLFLSKIERMIEIIEQKNPIKMIICDLDDTLWRGVAAEADDLSDESRTEGWPLGLIEALLFFKARGGLLAICSKNDMEETAARFDKIFRGAITLDDFAVVKINWSPKSNNIAEILGATNLLAKSCLFIDDNVREVSEVSARFPEMRCLGTDHYNWRRIVLQAAETQVPVITQESSQRTELVRETSKRAIEMDRLSNSEDDRLKWLNSLKLRQNVMWVHDENSKYYDRAFELINKTNQFNTNGKRWSSGEFQRFLREGGVCLVSSLRDENIDNGIISVCLIENDEIVQTVLSCRVFGLGAETVMAATAVDTILKNHKKAHAKIVDTGKNATCHNYYISLGFGKSDRGFEIDHKIPVPAYIQVQAI